uniref:TPX2 C-terminal domain-containing protein n=1 Tax=Leersia perrieri TaxID=77586 RepID=A0A0D9XTD2_9ORYZ
MEGDEVKVNGVVEEVVAEDYVVVKAAGEDGGAAAAVEGDLAGGEAAVEVATGGSEAVAAGVAAVKKGGSGGAAAAAARKAKPVVANGKVVSTGAPAAARGKKPVLSQSSSFPARGAVAKKDGAAAAKPVKSEGKVAAAAAVPNGSEKAAAGRAVEKKVNPARVAAARRSLPAKSGSEEAAPNDATSEAQESNENSTNALEQTLPGKMEDDVHSTTSSTNTPRTAQRKSAAAAAAGFSFRLQERAEKRKEESQEAEIKLLRKSLTFKATPMPSFYKEQPPKVELKKIPPTRARSPKLGRHKPNSVTAASADGSVSCESPRSITNLAKVIESAENNKPRVTARKPAQRSVTKTPSQASATGKTETKPLVAKQKSSNTKPKAPRAKVEQLQDNLDDIPPEETTGPEGHTGEHGVEDDATGPDRAATLVASNEVPVQG